MGLCFPLGREEWVWLSRFPEPGSQVERGWSYALGIKPNRTGDNSDKLPGRDERGKECWAETRNSVQTELS